MKNLILIRHAKSSWDVPLSDIDRSINQRGISNAHLVASCLEKNIPAKFLIQCSSAKRARETAIIFAENFIYPLENIIYRDELYTFDENKLEKVIKCSKNEYENIILFGHNDAITNFVNKFGDVYIDNVPTSGVVWIQFKTENWNELQQGKTIKTIFPKKIK